MFDIDHEVENKEETEIVLMNNIRIHRNIDKELFVGTGDKKQLKSMAENTAEIIKSSLKDINFELFDAEAMNSDLKRQYLKKKCITDKLLNNREKALFLLSSDENLSIMLNEEDHIVISLNSFDADIKKSILKACEYDRKIEEKIKYAFDEEFGYLTSELKRAGSGMTAEIWIHIPFLEQEGKVQEIADYLQKFEFKLRPAYDNKRKILGSVYKFSNFFSNQLTPEEMAELFKSLITHIDKCEKEAKEKLAEKYQLEIKDAVLRAEAILKNAVLLDFDEALEYTSKVKTGINMSIINDIETDKIDRILLNMEIVKKENGVPGVFTDKEKKYARAELMKKIIK